MKKIKRGKAVKILPDVIANVLIKNKGWREIIPRNSKYRAKEIVSKEDKTVIKTKEDKQIKKRSTK